MKTYAMQFGSGDPRVFTGLAPTFLIFFDMSAGITVAPPAISEIYAGAGIYKFAWGTTNPISFLADAATTTPGAQGRYVVGQLDAYDRADEYGTTMIAIGTSLTASSVTSLAYSSTLVAIGTSLTATGVTSLAYSANIQSIGVSLTASGISLTAFGSTSIAYSASIYAELGSTNSIASLLGTIGSTFGGVSTDPIDMFGYLKRIQELLEGSNQYFKASGTFNMYDRGVSFLLRSKTIANSVSAVIKS